MPPRTDREYGDTSFTGLPSSLIQAARDLAKRKKVYPRDVFQEAITELIANLDAGADIDWPRSRPRVGTRPYHARLEVDILEAMRKSCEQQEVKVNIFFMAALRDHLRQSGYDIEI